MSEIDKRVRLIGPWRVAVVILACIALLVTAVAAFAASPEPAGTGPSFTTPSGAPPKADPSGTTEKGTDKAGRDKIKSFLQNFARDLGKGAGQSAGHGATTITAIKGSDLSLKTDDGWTRTITVATDTKLTKGGQPIAVGDLKVGDKISFRQKKNDDGTYTIVSINVPTPVAAGEVTAVGTNTLTIKGRDGTPKTITLNGDTKYTLGGKAGAKSDASVGTDVTIQGTTSGDTFTALTVHVRLSEVAGVVTAKGTNSITIKGRDGNPVTIHTSPTTTFFVRGKGKAATLADIAVGDRVGASGTKNADGSIDAVGVVGGPAKAAKPAKPATPQTPTGSTQPG